MASVSEVLLLLSGDAHGALGAVREVRGELGQLDQQGEHTHGILGKLGGILAVAATAGAGILATAVASGVKAYSEIEDAQARLNAAMAAAGPAWAQSQTQINGNTKALNGLGLGTAEALKGMALLTQAHVPLDQQQRVLKAALDLSAGTGRDFASSLQAVLLGAQGSGRALKQFGLNLPPTVDSTKQLQAAIKKVADDQAALNKAVADYGPNSKEALKASGKLSEAQAKLRDIQQSYNEKLGGLPEVIDQSTAASAARRRRRSTPSAAR